MGLAELPKIADNFSAFFLVLIILKDINGIQQPFTAVPITLLQRSSECADALGGTLIVSQLFQIFLKVEAVQHMAAIREALTQADDPGCAVAVDIDVLHGIDVVARVQTGLHLIV